MKIYSLLLPALALLISLYACSADKESEPPNAGCGDFVEGTTREHYGREKPQFCDPRDGRLYVYVEIGGQTWMAENLNYSVFKGSKCYNDATSNCKKYGRLYDRATAMRACPDGWHTPSDAEWNELLNHIDDTTATEIPYYSKTAGKKLKAGSGWSPNFEGNSGNGTDDFGFSALPGGVGLSNGDPDDRVGLTGYFWSRDNTLNSIIFLSNEQPPYDLLYRQISDALLFSIRCVK